MPSHFAQAFGETNAAAVGRGERNRRRGQFFLLGVLNPGVGDTTQSGF